MFFKGWNFSTFVFQPFVQDFLKKKETIARNTMMQVLAKLRRNHRKKLHSLTPSPSLLKHTHSLSLSYTHTHFLTLSFILNLSLPLSLIIHTYISLSPFLPSLFSTRVHSFYTPISFTHTNTHTHTHTHTFSLTNHISYIWTVQLQLIKKSREIRLTYVPMSHDRNVFILLC